MDELPVSKTYNLTHFHQRYNWDCGISCIIMILSTAQKQQLIANFNAICKEEGFGSSTWTIDLCYLLRRFQVRHQYYTKTLGIDPEYKNHFYYTQIIVKDESRVIERFKNASANGLTVVQRTLDLMTLLKHLAYHGPVILLTNASQLTCEICKKDPIENFGYAGHYVVLCGYDLLKKKIYYRNPEVEDGHLCICSTESMDMARKSYGTDEDVIFVYNN